MLEIAKSEYGAVDLDGGPWQVIRKDGHEIIVKDVIADAFLQQILLRPAEPIKAEISLKKKSPYKAFLLSTIPGARSTLFK